MKPLWLKIAGWTLVMSVALGAQAQQPPASPPVPPQSLVLLPEKPELDAKALAILKAASDRLAAARSLSFTAIATYESPALTMQPLAYTTLSRVTVQRPDKLRVIVEGDGPPSEFYYDGKQVIAYEPQADLVAVDGAPPTIDEMLKVAYDKAAIMFPFEDVIVSDPYKGFEAGLKLAFYIGQSHVVAGTVTDMVAIANDTAQAQIWIGAEDKLPRMIRVTYFNEPGNFRHAVAFSDWKLDSAVPGGSFTSDRALKAKRIKFAAPDEQPKQK